ncbi:glycosyltransferase involved in cell wall biosynthesis [Salegentibacter sp. 24]|uniref:glycosyltransferase family 2 protein n=1 Tax=Salegentibacter sp. 24 TaxID=2183986 RepID=UPI0010607FC4|nr:glycosyltransferase family 2 protein [Salegentibacter sp. 24]TDN94957.1 glycosyltransferase involved in cell wall biosynthesis [Salegentibacter sp. 24]
MDYEFTIIVPIYNELDNLDRLSSTLLDYIKKASKKTKVLFINDGSTDGSQQALEDICEKQEFFGYLSFKKNRGLSTALKAGFDQVDTVLTGYIDADLQTDPEDFEHLLAVSSEHELVTGFRSNRQDSLIKKFSSNIANTIRQIFTKDGMDDTCCPLKVIHTQTAQRIPMFNGLHRFLPAMVLLQGGRIKQIPVRHYPRIAGVAKYHFFNRLIGPFTDCLVFLWMKMNYIHYEVAKKST